MQLNWQTLHSTGSPHSPHPVLHCSFALEIPSALAPKQILTLQLSIFKTDLMNFKTVTIYTRGAILETKQSVLLAKLLMNTAFLPPFLMLSFCLSFGKSF